MFTRKNFVGLSASVFKGKFCLGTDREAGEQLQGGKKLWSIRPFTRDGVYGQPFVC